MKVITKILSVFLIMIFIIYSMSGIVQANDQKEIVLVIDPGHGGKMTGTANNELGIIERDVTLKIARYLRDYLNEYEGIKVIMTHDGLPSDYEMELPARGMVARNNHADMMISLHINDSTTPNQQGAEVFVTANKLLPKYNEESTKFGNLVLNELSKLGISNRGVKTRLCGDTGPKWEYSDGSVADYYAVIRYPMKGDGEDRGADLAKRRRNSWGINRALFYEGK
ncbi:MAG: N-acetylmuramoyl-L-alanine amidase [Clostridia bacterium]|nr:N-acetylmuramoyl-L-alanine amidase [Clostridia bacterium]